MKFVVEADGENRVHPVTNMFDENGEDTEDKDKAAAIVVERDGMFYTFTVPSAAIIHTLH
jgi:hypothetical protein